MGRMFVAVVGSLIVGTIAGALSLSLLFGSGPPAETVQVTKQEASRVDKIVALAHAQRTNLIQATERAAALAKELSVECNEITAGYDKCWELLKALSEDKRVMDALKAIYAKEVPIRVVAYLLDGKISIDKSGTLILPTSATLDDARKFLGLK